MWPQSKLEDKLSPLGQAQQSFVAPFHLQGHHRKVNGNVKKTLAGAGILCTGLPVQLHTAKFNVELRCWSPAVGQFYLHVVVWLHLL